MLHIDYLSITAPNLICIEQIYWINCWNQWCRSC